ncbi:hypothetical protein OO014_02705 [Intrasporangium calvum]|uniref:Uncharacterized protein n=1 Tax=Intrasporangium calvum TaxID=53358 RepID=A0ABT5GEN7_9MICO|nr:hypothetical protein [Intrasporangium calvum]MDC5696151.1 hypothetical protein [Intrasporangium calvum]
MADTDLNQQKRTVVLMLGVSTVVAVLAAVVLQATSGADRDVLYWVLIAVLVSSIAEAGWYLVKYVRLSREAERLN